MMRTWSSSTLAATHRSHRRLGMGRRVWSRQRRGGGTALGMLLKVTARGPTNGRRTFRTHIGTKWNGTRGGTSHVQELGEWIKGQAHQLHHRLGPFRSPYIRRSVACPPIASAMVAIPVLEGGAGAKGRGGEID